jgi:Tfp pilus assembly protein PilF
MGPVSAQTPEEIWKMCFGPTSGRTISACTLIIGARDSYSARNVAIAYRNRGLGYRANGQSGRALVDFEESIRIDPTYVESYISRGNHQPRQRPYRPR